MARLHKRDDAAWWFVPTRCLLGRSRACAIRLESPVVSGEHALLRWTAGLWELQDLQSRNGTFVDGVRVDAGQRVRLGAGAALGFGRPDGYVLVDAAAPEAHAVPLDASVDPVGAEDRILTVPGPSDPQLIVYRHQQTWWLETEGDAREVVDGEVVEARGRWRLHLPEWLPSTLGDEGGRPSVADLSLHFAVQRERDYVELIARAGPRVIDLKARTFHHTLLFLAQVRLADHRLPPEQQGWIHQDELLRKLGYPAGQLHLHIHRLRRHFAEAGVADAAQIIERRGGTRQLRIGVAALEIAPLERQLPDEPTAG